ncbi:MAG: hypothetical protein KF855_11555 [Acidobacteria bacterium]|nr:hypothetical protein [Acidobacteriota bacterium]
MQILNRGSFVPLENREKIDHLIYTAREMATEMSRDEGFQNKSQTNHQLGLEVWTGSEYVCRAHEEANIRNLFLSKFLERLREIEKESSMQANTAPSTTMPVFTAPVQLPASAPVSLPPPTPQTAPEPPPQTAGQDKYLGVVQGDDQSHIPSYADECLPGYDAHIEAIVDRLDDEHSEPEADQVSEPINIESALPEITAADDASVEETTQIHPVNVEQNASVETTAREVQTEEVLTDAAETVESVAIEPLVIAEKEPYNFDGCTVTAVVQLLPEAEGVRKCVVSVRTHDFTPRVAIVDVTAAEVPNQISGTLGSMFEQYRNELPARAADKMKKEKPAAKKQAKSATKTAKPASAQTKATTTSEPAAAASTPTASTDQSQQGLFAS